MVRYTPKRSTSSTARRGAGSAPTLPRSPLRACLSSRRCPGACPERAAHPDDARGARGGRRRGHGARAGGPPGRPAPRDRITGSSIAALIKVHPEVLTAALELRKVKEWSPLEQIREERGNGVPASPPMIDLPAIDPVNVPRRHRLACHGPAAPTTSPRNYLGG